MKKLRIREIVVIGMIMIALTAGAVFVGSLRQTAVFNDEVIAAITNPSPGSPGYMMLNLALPGSYTGNQTDKVRFKMPWPATLLGFSAIVQNTGSTGAMTFNLKESGTTVLSAPIAVNEYAVTEATIADSSIADEAVMTIDVAVTAGTWTDPTVQILFKRK